MRTTAAFLLALVGYAQAVDAQAPTASRNPRPEIGFRAGFMQVKQSSDFGDNSFTTFALPTALPFSPGGLHAAFFVTPRVALEPQLAVIRISDDDGSFTLTSAAFQVNGFLGADATRAPYLFAQVATLREDEEDSDSQNGFGGGIGYRKVYRESLALRYELRFRRWNSEFGDSNEIGLLIGLGAVIR